ncbi:hypothetical protein [Microbacterium hydrocarbonoxydans]|uniref:hypothetical protein n=1 Tax=Microbacterium hydrocarbonoxydans TaxID=273678 RepID=UPI0020C8BB4C|nr:hypothetical protein [Microbacterium hydrocarbonoxydans]
MVLDGTVMNVSISTVVVELDTSVTAMQAAITFFTLTMPRSCSSARSSATSGVAAAPS